MMLGLTVLSPDACGQGAISFRNIGSGAGGTTVNARFYAENLTTDLSVSGRSIQLWYGPAATPEALLTPLASTIAAGDTFFRVTRSMID